MKYNIITIQDYLDDILLLEKLFERFSCPFNTDIESFLKTKAINFNKKHFSRTYLVTNSEFNLVGYFTIAIKAMNLTAGVSNKLKKLVSGYSNKPDSAVFLIGQLAKNYSLQSVDPISGEELLNLAIDQVLNAQEVIGGRAIMIECEDNPALISFYERLGFTKLNLPNNSGLLTYVMSISNLH